MSQPLDATWFNQPQGADCPENSFKRSAIKKSCRVTIAGDENSVFGSPYTSNWKIQFHMFSQQPWIELSCEVSGITASIDYTAQDSDIVFTTETPTDKCPERIAYEKWFKDLKADALLSCAEITSLKAPVIRGTWWNLPQKEQDEFNAVVNVKQGTIVYAWRRFELSYDQVPIMHNWFNVLSDRVKTNKTGARLAYWHYLNDPLYKANVTEETTVGFADCDDKDPKRMGSCLWLQKPKAASSAQQDGDAMDIDNASPPEWTQWPWSQAHFHDKHELGVVIPCCLRNERQDNTNLFSKLFSETNLTHDAIFEEIVESGGQYAFAHITLSKDFGVTDFKPQAGTLFKLRVYHGIREDDAAADEHRAMVSNHDTTADFCLIVELSSEVYERSASQTVNLLAKADNTPLDRMIASYKTAVFMGNAADKDPSLQQFGLRRTLLAHRQELNPNSAMIDYVLAFFTLQGAQVDAFERSVRDILVGISLILGPPGTGKTRVSASTVIAIAACELKLLIAAGSNQGIDNLFAALVRFVESDPQLKAWCGQIVRLPVESATIRCLSTDDDVEIDETANHRIWDEAVAPIKLSTGGDSEIVQRYGLANYIKAFVHNNPEKRHVDKFKLILDKAITSGLSNKEDRKELKDKSNKMKGYVLAETRICATTCNNASDIHALAGDSTFLPDVAVIDEAAQTLEADNVIALRFQSLKSIVMVGDFKQLAALIATALQDNEEGALLARSLLERLHDAGFPSVMLTDHYRCHPEILDLFNRLNYDGNLVGHPSTIRDTPITRAWNDFTRARTLFKNVRGKRRIFIDAPGFAEQREGRSSLLNKGATDVLCTLLTDLLQFQNAQGDQIRPNDIALISPYSDQRWHMNRTLPADILPMDNTTIDGGQGHEWDFGVLMLTRPKEDKPLVPGFLSDERRLNVGLSRVRDVLIIIGNLEHWTDEGMQTMNKQRKANHLCALVRDVRHKGDVVYWTREPQNDMQRVPEFETLPVHAMRPLPVGPQPLQKRKAQMNPTADINKRSRTGRGLDVRGAPKGKKPDPMDIIPTPPRPHTPAPDRPIIPLPARPKHSAPPPSRLSSLPADPESYEDLPHDFVPEPGNKDDFLRWKEHVIRKGVERDAASEARSVEIARRKEELSRLESELKRLEASHKTKTDAADVYLSGISNKMDDLNRWYIERGLEPPE